MIAAAGIPRIKFADGATTPRRTALKQMGMAGLAVKRLGQGSVDGGQAVRVMLALLMVAAGAGSAAAQDLSNQAFQIQYDDSGIRSLKRTGDAHDTDYIAENGRLGRLLIRYRTTPNGDWRELRELSMAGAQSGRSISYLLGARQPTLASRSTAAAATGAAGLRGLNDGLVPAPPPAAGRAAGPGAAPAFDAPVFTWSGARGPSQWVQYTFPDDQQVSRVDVFWVRPPASWRLVYQVNGEWKEVAARGAYGTAGGAYTSLEFEPVKTMAMRIEAQMAPDATVSLAEWRVGGDPEVGAAADLNVQQSFALTETSLDWTVTLNNRGSRPVEIGDLAVPFQFAERTGARGDIYTKKLLRHAYVGGHGSFVYWQRSNGVGPYLVMTPGPGTKFEYYDSIGRHGHRWLRILHALHLRQGRARRRGRRRWQLAASRQRDVDRARRINDLHLQVSMGEGLRRRP